MLAKKETIDAMRQTQLFYWITCLRYRIQRQLHFLFCTLKVAKYLLGHQMTNVLHCFHPASLFLCFYFLAILARLILSIWLIQFIAHPLKRIFA